MSFLFITSDYSFQKGTHNEKKAYHGPASHIYTRPKENTVASALLCVDAAGIKRVQINIGVFNGVCIEYEAALDRPAGDQEIAGDRDRE